MMTPMLAVATAFVVSLAGTEMVRRYALKKQLLDVPNARSSHSAPTPRGGGIAIVAGVASSLLLLRLAGLIDPPIFYALFAGGLAVAAVGLLDDRASVPPAVRILVHTLSAGAAMWWAGGWPVLQAGDAGIEWGGWGSVLGVLAIVWSTNLFNFMDGIDGIAASQAIFVFSMGAILGSGAVSLVPLLVTASAAGFLVWNWPPARIFMGDSGSCFIGFIFGVVAIYSTTQGATEIWPWLTLMALFAADATVTLFRRASRGERFWEAHSSHAYQRWARRCGSHRPVTVAVILTNLLIIAPLALLANGFREWGAHIAIATLVVAMVAARILGAGRPAQTESG